MGGGLIPPLRCLWTQSAESGGLVFGSSPALSGFIRVTNRPRGGGLVGDRTFPPPSPAFAAAPAPIDRIGGRAPGSPNDCVQELTSGNEQRRPHPPWGHTAGQYWFIRLSISIRLSQPKSAHQINYPLNPMPMFTYDLHTTYLPHSHASAQNPHISYVRTIIGFDFYYILFIY